MADHVYPSGSTLSSPRAEALNAERLAVRMCRMDDLHPDGGLPFASVLVTITSTAHGTSEHPRGRWQSGIPLCQGCHEFYQANWPFGSYMVDATLPPLCQECGCLAPCTNCAEDPEPF